MCEACIATYVAETWALTEKLDGLLASCDHRMLKYMPRVQWQDWITINEEVRRRYGMENLKNRLKIQSKVEGKFY